MGRNAAKADPAKARRRELAKVALRLELYTAAHAGFILGSKLPMLLKPTCLWNGHRVQR